MFTVLLSIVLSSAFAITHHVVVDAEGNSYKLVMKIGEGGYSDIYLAQQLVNGQLQPSTKAIKVLDYGEAELNTELLRNYRTAQTITASHPEYFLPFQIGDLSARNSSSDHIIIMPTLKTTLEQEVFSLTSIKSRTSLAVETLILFINTADILMRHGYIHGDIMTSNIGRTTDNRLVLLDFDSFSKIGSRTSLNTSVNAPPEYLRTGRANLVTDVYAMGITLGQVLFFPSFDNKYSLEQVEDFSYKNRLKLNSTESLRHTRALELFISASLEPEPNLRQTKLRHAIQQIRSKRLLSVEHSTALESFEKTLSEKSQRLGFFRSIAHTCSDIFNL